MKWERGVGIYPVTSVQELKQIEKRELSQINEPRLGICVECICEGLIVA